VRPEVRAALGFIEKMSRTPDALGPDDVDAVYAAGVSRAALEDAIHVCANFSVIVRIADAFEFHIPSKADFIASAHQLLKRGYRGG
jgi:alkylhydroperoxidase family enzyme